MRAPIFLLLNPPFVVDIGVNFRRKDSPSGQTRVGWDVVLTYVVLRGERGNRQALGGVSMITLTKLNRVGGGVGWGQFISLEAGWMDERERDSSKER